MKHRIARHVPALRGEKMNNADNRHRSQRICTKIIVLLALSPMLLACAKSADTQATATPSVSTPATNSTYKPTMVAPKPTSTTTPEPTIPTVDGYSLPPSVESTDDGSVSSDANSWDLIAFIGGGGSSLFTIRPDGSESAEFVLPIPVQNRLLHPQWSPDGTRLAIDIDARIFVVTADGSDAEFVTQGHHPTWSPDGQQIAFDRASGGAFVHNLVTGTERLLVEGYWYPAWSPDGNTIALHELKRVPDVYLIDADGTNLRPLTQTPLVGEYVANTAWSPDGRRLLIAATDHDQEQDSSLGKNRRIETLDLASGAREIVSYVHSPGLTSAWSPDGRQIVFDDVLGIGAKASRNLFIVDLESNEIRQLTFVSGQVYLPTWQTIMRIANADLQRDSQRPVVFDQERDVPLSRLLAEMATEMLDKDLDLASLLAIEAVRFAHTFEADTVLRETIKRQRWVGAAEGEVFGNELYSLSSVPVRKMIFSPDSSVLTTIDESGGRIRSWDSRTGQQLYEVLPSDQANAGSVDAAYSPVGTLLATVDGTSEIRFWNPSSGIQLFSWSTNGIFAGTVAFSPDGEVVATAGSSLEGSSVSISFWRAKTGEKLGDALQFYGLPSYLLFSPDGRYLTARGVDIDGSYLIDVNDPGRSTGLAATPTRHFRAPTFSPDGMLLGIATDSSIDIWNVETMSPIRSIDRTRGYAQYTGIAVWSPNGRWLAVSGRSGELEIWDAQGQYLVMSLEQEGNSRIAWSPDSTMLTSANGSLPSSVWNIDERYKLAKLSVPKDSDMPWYSTTRPLLVGIDSDQGLVDVTWSPDGEMIAGVARDDWRVFVWPATPTGMIQQACRYLGRNLTEEEWEQYLPDEVYRKTCP